LFLRKSWIEAIDQNIGINESGHGRTAPPASNRGIGVFQRALPLPAVLTRGSLIEQLEPFTDIRSVFSWRLRSQADRITGAGPLNLPGSIPNRLASVFGIVTWNLLVTFAMSLF